MSSSLAEPVWFSHRGQVDDDGDEGVPAPGVPPGVLVDPDDAHPSNRCGSSIRTRRPRPGPRRWRCSTTPEGPSDAGDAQVLADDALQRPAQSTARQLRPRLGGPAGVLAPHVPAAGAPVAADRDQQRRRAPPERLVRQPTDDAVPRAALASAATTPPVGVINRVCDPARQHRTVRLQMLSHHDETELVQTAERRQIRTGEGNVGHVEVFQTGRVGTPIIGRPRPLPGHTPTPPLHPQLRRAGLRLLLDWR